MRPLKTADVFKLSGILRKLKLKKELAEMNVKDMTVEQFGLHLFLLLFENIDQAEKEITEFFADIAEMKPEEFKDMEIEKLGEFINELSQAPGLKNFFRSALKIAAEK